MKKPCTPLDLKSTFERYFKLREATWKPSTVRSRRYLLLRFARYLQCQDPHVVQCSQIRRRHVEDWIVFRKGLHPRTRSDNLQIIQQVFTDMREWRWADAPPPGLFHETDFPSIPQRLPKPLSPEADQRLQAQLEGDVSVMALGLKILRLTGLRSGELLSLPPDPVHCLQPGQYAIRVPPGKTNTERLFPLTPPLQNIITQLQQRRGCSAQRELPPFLMVMEQGHRVNMWTLRRYMKRAARLAGLSGWTYMHLHQLRHTFATELARTGIPLPSLMALLGHRHPNITMKYVELTSQDVRQAYQRALDQLPPLAVPSLPRSVRDLTDPETLAEHFEDLIRRLEHARRQRPKECSENFRRLIKRLHAAYNTFKHMP